VAEILSVESHMGKLGLFAEDLETKLDSDGNRALA
jgi:hypothetical protein